MARIVLLLSVNLDHSEVRERRVLTEGLPALLVTLRGAPIPVVLAIQQRDIEVAGLTFEDLEGLDILAAPYAHGMEGLLVGRHIPRLTAHCVWQARNGFAGTVNGTFRPEFSDALAQGVHEEGRIFPCLAEGTTTWYTSVGEGFARVEEVAHEAVRFRGQIWTPMVGVMELVRGYQLFQRDPNDLNGARARPFVEALTRFGESSDEIRFMPMDVEAALVGSHHGLQVWRRFFELLTHHGLTHHFASFAEAETRWRQVATDASDLVMEGQELLLPNRDEAKWRCRRLQNEYLVHLQNTLGYDSDVGQVLSSVASTSDVFSCMGGMLNPRPVRLSADRGDLVIQGTWDMEVLGRVAMEGLSHIRSCTPSVERDDQLVNFFRWKTGELNEAGRLTDDGLWYARRIIERCLKPRLG